MPDVRWLDVRAVAGRSRLSRLTASLLFITTAIAFVACAGGDAGVETPTEDAGPGADGGGDGGPDPIVEETCPALAAKSPPGADDVCAVEKGSGSGVLYVGEVLTPGKITNGG